MARLAPETRKKRLKIGLLGGSFNPAHDGHLHISLQAIRLLGLDEVWWLVSPLNPLKQAKDMVDYETRLKTAGAVAENHPINVSDFEKTSGTRYTADMLKELTKRYPAVRFVWLMGADNLREFHLWKNWREIIKILPIAVFDRKNYAPKALHKRFARVYATLMIDPRKSRFLAYRRSHAWTFLKIKKRNISATEIRKNQELLWQHLKNPTRKSQ